MLVRVKDLDIGKRREMAVAPSGWGVLLLLLRAALKAWYEKFQDEVCYVAAGFEYLNPSLSEEYVIDDGCHSGPCARPCV